MNFKKIAAVVGVVVSLAGGMRSASAQEYSFDFSSNLLAFITFLGDPTRLITFPGRTFDFTITNSSDGLLDGLQGNIDTIGFSVGPIISPIAGVDYATVTGTGEFSIFDGTNTLTADITFREVYTVLTSVGLSYGTSINIGNFNYSGTNAGLQRVANSLETDDPLSPTVTISSQFVPPRSLSQLMARKDSSSSYSGSFYSAAPIPEPSTYAMLAVGLGMVGFSLARARRS
jgi:hypothetical protein